MTSSLRERCEDVCMREENCPEDHSECVDECVDGNENVE
jgi:hypothetical protein